MSKVRVGSIYLNLNVCSLMQTSLDIKANQPTSASLVEEETAG